MRESIEIVAIVSTPRPSYTYADVSAEASAFLAEYADEDVPAAVSFPTASYATARDMPFSTTLFSLAVVPTKVEAVDFHVPRDEETMFPIASYV